MISIRGGGFVALLAVTMGTFAQSSAPAPATATSQPAQRADLFDFWVGDWALSWRNPDGTLGTGRNRIVKILDGSVVEENFEANAASNPAPLLKGRSLSVRQAGGIWRQAWADNQGGFFVLRAQVDGDSRIFITDPVQRGGKTIVQRMVFHSIKPNSLIWDWESSNDGGATWQRQWRVDYVRR